MVNATSHPPQSPPAAPKPPASHDDEPPKYKRPLPQPGDKDYVTGQPTTEEEATKIEKQEAEKHAAAKAANQESKR